MHLYTSQSYKQFRIHLDPKFHLAGYPLGLPQGPLGVPGPHFENRSNNYQVILTLIVTDVRQTNAAKSNAT